MRPIDAVALADVLNNLWVATSPSKYDDKETAFERAAMCRGIDDCIKYVHDSPTIGGWISVKERLPEEDKDVLAYNGAYMFIAAYTTNPTKYWYTITGSATLAITHWMPLPEPPKEEKV